MRFVKQDLFLVISFLEYSDAFTTPTTSNAFTTPTRARWGDETFHSPVIISAPFGLYAIEKDWEDVEVTNDEVVPNIQSSLCTTMGLEEEEGEKEDEQQGLNDSKRNAQALLVGAAALYGTNFAVVKMLGDVMPVGISSALRFSLAALVTLPWLFEDVNKEGALMAAWLGFEIGLWNSIGYIAQAVGLETTQASNSAFICSLAVVTVPLLDFVAGKRLLSRQWIGAILAVVGVAFLELGGDAAQSSLSVGDKLSLVQPFAFGVGFWRMEQALQRFPSEARRLTAAQLLAVFCASTGYGLWAIDLSSIQSYPWAEWLTSASVLFSLFWTGVVTTALTIYMENVALETLSATEATVIFSTEPLWGTAFAAAVMGEQLGPNAAIGAVCILTACVYSSLGVEGVKAMLEGLNVTEHTRKPLAVRDLPAVLQKQWMWFSSSFAATLASWNVVAANAAELPEEMEKFDETVNEVIAKILDNLP